MLVLPSGTATDCSERRPIVIERARLVPARLGRSFTCSETLAGQVAPLVLWCISHTKGRKRRMPTSAPYFSSIDLARHAALCVAFRRDSYVCSFGSDRLFIEENGADAHGYIEWLAARIAQFPEGHVHVWQRAQIIGQIEMMLGPSSAYINLFYLRPDARGRGLGSALHAYAVDLLQRHDISVAGLSVSPTNQRAIKYYQRHGWKDQGPRAGAPHVHELELHISPAPRDLSLGTRDMASTAFAESCSEVPPSGVDRTPTGG
jgi:ribosomal protein S18 acetylase RimI-like enzyme